MAFQSVDQWRQILETALEAHGVDGVLMPFELDAIATSLMEADQERQMNENKNKLSQGGSVSVTPLDENGKPTGPATAMTGISNITINQSPISLTPQAVAADISRAMRQLPSQRMTLEAEMPMSNALLAIISGNLLS